MDHKLEPHQMAHWFIASSYAPGTYTEDRVKNCIGLLHQVPACRYAVLNKFSTLFEEAVGSCLDKIEFKSSGVTSDTANNLDLIVTTLFGFLKVNGEAWAPLLCSWSMNALGHISACYKQRLVIPSPNNLGNMLRFWLNVVPMRMLLDIYRCCLRIMINNNNKMACIDSLLSVSESHSNYFDWVIADVGNSFPDTIIESILHTSFSKFCKLRSVKSSTSSNVTMHESEQSILNGVVRILEHLIPKHKDDVCKVMMEIFKFPPAAGNKKKVNVVLFLMNVFSLSQSLLKSTTVLFLKQIDTQLLNSLFEQYQKLTLPTSERETLKSLVVHLMCNASVGSYKLLRLILDRSFDEVGGKKGLNPDLIALFKDILISFLKDLQRLSVTKSNADKRNHDNVFTELLIHYEDLCLDLLKTSSSEKRSSILSILLSLCYKQHAVEIVAFILSESTSTEHLHIFTRMYSDLYSTREEFIESILEMLLSFLSVNTCERSINILSNINTLLTSDTIRVLQPDFRSRLAKGICLMTDDLLGITSHSSSSIEYSHSAISLLVSVMPRVTYHDLRTSTRVLPMTQALVTHFFRLVSKGYSNTDVEMMTCQQALIYLTQAPQCFKMVCGFILGSVLSKKYSTMFGARIDLDMDASDDPCVEQHVSLLAKHRSLTASKLSMKVKPKMGMGFRPIAVEAGLIGTGPKRKKKCPLSKLSQISNFECLSMFIYRCCCKTTGGLEVGITSLPDESNAYDQEKLVDLANSFLKAVANSSVHLGSLLTLDGDCFWPPPYVRKSTIERDIQAFNFLEEHPFVWQILELLSRNTSALWTFSPILRACMSVLMVHYESSRYSEPPDQSSLHYQTACKLIILLKKSRILPTPLGDVHEIFHLIHPYEIYSILAVVWNFIKDFPPPTDSNSVTNGLRDFAKESINQQNYLETVKRVIHMNINKLGQYFSRFTVLK